MTTFPARGHSASRPGPVAHSLSNASLEVLSPSAPTARRVLFFSSDKHKASPRRPQLCLGRDLSAFRVSHPLDGLLLVEPRRFVSPDKHSWGSVALCPSLRFEDAPCLHVSSPGQISRPNRNRAAAWRRRDERISSWWCCHRLLSNVSSGLVALTCHRSAQTVKPQCRAEARRATRFLHQSANRLANRSGGSVWHHHEGSAGRLTHGHAHLGASRAGLELPSH
jgi:hypothetical protein